MIVDAHHHLWHYRPAGFGWINDRMQVIRRDFLPVDLEGEITQAGVDATVAVQAQQSVEETQWLLQQASHCTAIRGVVGWVPLIEPNVPDIIAQLSEDELLKGLRHVIQDEPDDQFMLRDDFNRGISSLAGTGLVYDILIYSRHLPQTIEFVDRHPEQVFVLDHIAKPPIAKGELEPWAAHLRQLALRPNVSCKVSGMVTEADWAAWSLDDLRPYLDVVVESFGPERLMVGSDWPVCLVASGYKRWFDTLRQYFGTFSDVEQAAIFGATATRIYNL